MKAKVRFFMANRKEYEYEVEADTQQGLYALAHKELVEEIGMLADMVSGSVRPEFYEIENWKSTPVDGGGPTSNKQDGIAARSPKQKVRFDLLPLGPLTAVAQVFTFGAFTYGDRNWEEGFSYSRCIGSIWRHFLKWSLGENDDDESGVSHLAHVIANCLFLMEYVTTGQGNDDRQTIKPKQIQKMFTPIRWDRPNETPKGS
jgi:hypothetical protein